MIWAGTGSVTKNSANSRHLGMFHSGCGVAMPVAMASGEVSAVWPSTLPGIGLLADACAEAAVAHGPGLMVDAGMVVAVWTESKFHNRCIKTSGVIKSRCSLNSVAAACKASVANTRAAAMPSGDKAGATVGAPADEVDNLYRRINTSHMETGVGCHTRNRKKTNPNYKTKLKNKQHVKGFIVMLAQSI